MLDLRTLRADPEAALARLAPRGDPEIPTLVETALRHDEDRRRLIGEVETLKAERRGEHDCVVLFSGGKDSTYMLYQLVALGLKPLTFTLDNGFISDGAKDNIRRAAAHLCPTPRSSPRSTAAPISCWTTGVCG